MAELLASTGHVDATDIHKHKIGLIKENIKKLKLKNVSTFIMMQHNHIQNYMTKF